MRIDTAIELIENICFWPGWKFTATDLNDRFEGAICLRIDYEARNGNRENAPDYIDTVSPSTSFPIHVSDLDQIGLYHAVFDKIQVIREHEDREGFRVQPTLWAPFHPHNIGGMTRWKNRPELVDLSGDLQFGLA